MTYVKGVRGQVVENLAGKTFNRLTAVERDMTKAKRAYWICTCKCGGVISVAACDLKSGHTKSCGCLNRESRVINNTTHGYNRTRTYVVWSNMWARCTNRNRHDYKNYGGRGITVCERWKRFEAFLADMGEKPDHLSLDRIINDEGYAPENCRWATASEQRKNQRLTRIVRAAAEIGRRMPETTP